MLTQASLWELYQNEGILRTMDLEGRLNPQELPTQPYLYQGFDTFAGRSFTGVITVADAVQALMEDSPLFESTLENTTDEEVKLAVHSSAPGTCNQRTTRDPFFRGHQQKHGRQRHIHRSLVFPSPDHQRDSGQRKAGRRSPPALPWMSAKPCCTRRGFDRNVQSVIAGRTGQLPALGDSHRPEPGSRGRRLDCGHLHHVHHDSGVSGRGADPEVLLGDGADRGWARNPDDLAPGPVQLGGTQGWQSYRAPGSHSHDRPGGGLCRSCPDAIPGGARQRTYPQDGHQDRFRRCAGEPCCWR